MELILPQTPQEIVQLLVGKLSGRRMRDILEKRFSLRVSGKKTLEAIGKEYKITRERVRQIEAEALRQVRSVVQHPEYQPMIRAIRDYLERQGGLVARERLLERIPNKRERTHLAFFLTVAPGIHGRQESEEFHARWSTDEQRASAGEGVLRTLGEDLERSGDPIRREELEERMTHYARQSLGNPLDADQRDALLGCSKLIRKNPYGEYGLAGWSVIAPSGVRDKAYAALRQHAKPLHFLKVAEAITAAQWSSRRAHPQTVHNELIKDPRFVLVGRGLYALAEWGYEAGPVRDIIASVLRESHRPLTREEVIQKVLEKRFVKPPTILLNLQNASLFARNDKGTYTLA